MDPRVVSIEEVGFEGRRSRSLHGLDLVDPLEGEVLDDGLGIGFRGVPVGFLEADHVASRS